MKLKSKVLSRACCLSKRHPPSDTYLSAFLLCSYVCFCFCFHVRSPRFALLVSRLLSIFHPNFSHRLTYRKSANITAEHELDSTMCTKNQKERTYGLFWNSNFVHNDEFASNRLLFWLEKLADVDSIDWICDTHNFFHKNSNIIYSGENNSKDSNAQWPKSLTILFVFVDRSNTNVEVVTIISNEIITNRIVNSYN